MAGPRRIDIELVAKAKRIAARATDLGQPRAAQAVLLPALAGIQQLSWSGDIDRVMVAD
jgi:hypothetical protein